jgi:mannosyltransferase OCH1-like enzyme
MAAGGKVNRSMVSLGIPRRLSHIWIGPRPAPEEWMQTWRQKHPTWDYTLYGNDYLRRTRFRNQALIDFYMEAGQYAGVADLMRYEILHEFGGFMPEADSLCRHPVDDLFHMAKAYTVYENEFVRGKLVSPILACEPKNKFVGILIDRLGELRPDDLIDPWMSTGNLFVAEMIERYGADVHVFPSHTFIPVHPSGRVYDGPEKVYAFQLFGTTRGAYAEDRRAGLAKWFSTRSQKKKVRAIRARMRDRRRDLFGVERDWQ